MEITEIQEKQGFLKRRRKRRLSVANAAEKSKQKIGHGMSN